MDRRGKDTPRQRADAWHEGSAVGELREGTGYRSEDGPAPEACGTQRTTRGARPRAWGTGRIASGAQPAAVMGRNAKTHVRRGVRAAKDWVDFAYQTVPGRRSLITPSLRRCSPRKRFRESSARSLLALPGTGTGPPSFLDGETWKAGQRIQYWCAGWAHARVSGLCAQDHELRLTGACTGP